MSDTPGPGPDFAPPESSEPGGWSYSGSGSPGVPARSPEPGSRSHGGSQGAPPPGAGTLPVVSGGLGAPGRAPGVGESVRSGGQPTGVEGDGVGYPGAGTWYGGQPSGAGVPAGGQAPGIATGTRNNAGIVAVVIVVVLALTGAGYWYVTSHNIGGTTPPATSTMSPASPATPSPGATFNPATQGAISDPDSDKFMNYAVNSDVASSYSMFADPLKNTMSEATWADDLARYGWNPACEVQWNAVDYFDVSKIVTGQLTCGDGRFLVVITWDIARSDTHLVSRLGVA